MKNPVGAFLDQTNGGAESGELLPVAVSVLFRSLNYEVQGFRSFRFSELPIGGHRNLFSLLHHDRVKQYEVHTQNKDVDLD